MEEAESQLLEIKYRPTWFNNRGVRGLEWVVHNSTESLICFRIQKVKRKWDIKIMEAKVILVGIKAIHQTFLQKQIELEVESNALTMIKVLAGEDENLSNLKPLTKSIATL